MVAVVAMVAVSGASLQAEYRGDKEHWRDWAKAVSFSARFGYPLVIFPSIAPTLLYTYEPGSFTGIRLDFSDSPDLSALLSFASVQPALCVTSFSSSPFTRFY